MNSLFVVVGCLQLGIGFMGVFWLGSSVHAGASAIRLWFVPVFLVVFAGGIILLVSLKYLDELAEKKREIRDLEGRIERDRDDLNRTKPKTSILRGGQEFHLGDAYREAGRVVCYLMLGRPIPTHAIRRGQFWPGHADGRTDPPVIEYDFGGDPDAWYRDQAMLWMAGGASLYLRELELIQEDGSSQIDREADEEHASDQMLGPVDEAIEMLRRHSRSNADGAESLRTLYDECLNEVLAGLRENWHRVHAVATVMNKEQGLDSARALWVARNAHQKSVPTTNSEA